MSLLRTGTTSPGFGKKRIATYSLRVIVLIRSAQTFTIAESLGLRVFAGPRQPAQGKQLTVQVPAFAAELVVLE